MIQNELSGSFKIFACHSNSDTPYIKDGYFVPKQLPPNSFQLSGDINIWEHLFEPIIPYDHNHIWDENDNVMWVDKFPYNPTNFLTEPEFNNLEPPGIHERLFETKNPYYWNTPELYKHPHFQALRKYYGNIIQKYIKPKDTIKNKIQNLFNQKTPQHRWLGIHLRIPQHHYINLKDDNIDNYFNLITQNIIPLINELNVHRIFVATESLEIIEKLQIVCGKDNVLFHEMPRLRGNYDWNMRSEKTYRITYLEECTNAYLDVYSLAQCDVIIGACSNMFTSALFINPLNEFRIIPCLETFPGA
jgi:hypothetical protein